MLDTYMVKQHILYRSTVAKTQDSLRNSSGHRQRAFTKHQVFFQNASCVVFVIAPLQLEGLTLGCMAVCLCVCLLV